MNKQTWKSSLQIKLLDNPVTYTLETETKQMSQIGTTAKYSSLK